MDSRKFSFPFRVVKVWNSLPEGVVLTPSLTAFKQRIDRHWTNQAIKWDYTASLDLYTRANRQERHAYEDPPARTQK